MRLTLLFIVHTKAKYHITMTLQAFEFFGRTQKEKKSY